MSDKLNYELMRAHVLALGASPETAHMVSNAELFAWANRIFPTHHADEESMFARCGFGDDVLDVGKDFALRVLHWIDEKERADASVTFYGLEDAFGGKSNRVELLRLCRYWFLNGLWSKELFEAMSAAGPGISPSEAHGLARDFNLRSEIYL